jgi:hypothetical protein
MTTTTTAAPVGASLFEPIDAPELERVRCVLCDWVGSGSHFGRNGHARKHIAAGEARKVQGRHIVRGAA